MYTIGSAGLLPEVLTYRLPRDELPLHLDFNTGMIFIYFVYLINFQKLLFERRIVRDSLASNENNRNIGRSHLFDDSTYQHLDYFYLEAIRLLV